MGQLMSVSMHGCGDDDLDAMVGDVVTALGLTDVTLDEQRDYPADGDLGPFTSLAAHGNLGEVRVHVTAFTHHTDTTGEPRP